MKQLFLTLMVLLSLVAVQAEQADLGRSLTNPADALKENDCVFKNKGVVALQAYEFIVDKCDRRYSPSLMIIADHLPQGACVFDLVQKMSGHTIARVIKQCPSFDNQEVQGIIPDAPLEHMPPPILVAEPAVKKQAAKPKTKVSPAQPEEQAPVAAVITKKKEEVKPKTNEQIEKGNDGYYINPEEIEF